MSVAVRSGLGIVGAFMLLHAGYSAFESLTYEKSVDPNSPLDIPLDVNTLSRLRLISRRLSWRL